jgi:hypothetical protein
MSIHVDVPNLKSPEFYRRLARAAVHRAESSPLPYFRLSYLSLASGWRALANEAEQMQDACLHAEVESIKTGRWPEIRPS